MRPTPTTDPASGGRVAVPLAVPLDRHLSKAIVFLIERDDNTYSARVIGAATIFTAAGTGPSASLARSFERGDAHSVRLLRRDAHPPEASC